MLFPGLGDGDCGRRDPAVVPKRTKGCDDHARRNREEATGTSFVPEINVNYRDQRVVDYRDRCHSGLTVRTRGPITPEGLWMVWGAGSGRFLDLGA